MIVTLHEKQRVLVSSRIRFQHRADSGRQYEIVLNKKQFHNLNDIIDNLHSYPSLCYLPLGGGLWLFQKGAATKLIDNHKHTFFSFYEKAWHFYIAHVHASLYDSVCYGKSDHHQSDAQYESRPTHSSRKSSSHSSKYKQTLSRSSRNARHQNVKRAQHAIISRRKGADPRTRVRHGSRKHASRIHQDIETDQQDATFSSDDNDSIESGDQCSIEEGYPSPEDCVE